MTYVNTLGLVDAFEKAIQLRRNAARGLTPLYTPAAATRDAAAGASTSSVCHGDTAPEPVGRLGGVVTLDTLPGPAGRVSGLTTQYLAAAGEPRLRGWLR